MSSDWTLDNLAALEALCRSATPGPWEWSDKEYISAIDIGETVLWPRNCSSEPEDWSQAIGACGERTEDDAEANAAFIAAANPAAILSLIAALKAERERAEKAEEASFTYWNDADTGARLTWRDAYEGEHSLFLDTKRRASAAESRLAEREKEIERLVEALRFYANVANWYQSADDMPSPVRADRGKRAADALLSPTPDPAPGETTGGGPWAGPFRGVVTEPTLSPPSRTGYVQPIEYGFPVAAATPSPASQGPAQEAGHIDPEELRAALNVVLLANGAKADTVLSTEQVERALELVAVSATSPPAEEPQPVAWRRATKQGWEYRATAPTEATLSKGWLALFAHPPAPGSVPAGTWFAVHRHGDVLAVSNPIFESREDAQSRS